MNTPTQTEPTNTDGNPWLDPARKALMREVTKRQVRAWLQDEPNAAALFVEVVDDPASDADQPS